MNRPISLLEARIKTEALLTGGTIGIYFQDLADGETIQFNENLIFPSASVIKIPIMVHIIKLVEIDELTLHTTIDMDLSLPEYQQDEGSGILTHLTSKISLNIRDLVMLMIIESDNLATNQLLKLVRMLNINETMSSFNLQHTRVTRPIDDFEALREDTSNPATPKEIATLLKNIFYKKIYLSDLMIEMLKEQKYASRIPFLLPDDDKDLKIAHKTGTLDGIVHDVGLILYPRFNYVLSIMTKNQQSNLNATLAIARISEIIYQYMLTKYV